MAGATYLASHGGVGGNVLDLADSASISRAQILDDLEVLWAQVEVELDADFQLRRGILRVVVPGMAKVVCILGGGWRLGSCRRQGEALDVLALHGARGE